MLNSVGARTPICDTPVLNWRCVDVSECRVRFAFFDVVCDEFENCVLCRFVLVEACCDGVMYVVLCCVCGVIAFEAVLCRDV